VRTECGRPLLFSRLMFSSLLESLQQRAQREGGFVDRAGGEYRPDAIAWAILPLAAAGARPDLIERGRVQLANQQRSDERVCVSADHPEAFWPTPLAVLAWHGSPGYREPQSRAVAFLFDTAGVHWQKEAGSPVAHDTSVRGWPWIAGTHSMVEPTSLSLPALRVTGNREHERVWEAVRIALMEKIHAQRGLRTS